MRQCRCTLHNSHIYLIALATCLRIYLTVLYWITNFDSVITNSTCLCEKKIWSYSCKLCYYLPYRETSFNYFALPWKLCCTVEQHSCLWYWISSIKKHKITTVGFWLVNTIPNNVTRIITKSRSFFACGLSESAESFPKKPHFISIGLKS